MPILWTGTSVSVDPRNLLVGNGHGLSDMAARNIQQTADPLFAAPAQGDFRLQAGSQARNRWSPGNGVDVPDIDLAGATRPAPVDGPTPYDFGAFEYGALVDMIIYDGFETWPVE